MFSWSPDGVRIAYRAHMNDFSQALFTTFPDGTGNVIIASGIGSIYYEWSPDGTRIAYQAYKLGEFGFVMALFTTFPDGTGKVVVSSPDRNPGVQYFKWSPNSSRIGYMSNVSTGLFGSFGTLFTSFPDGSGNTKVNSLGGDVAVFKWSPDGTRIAYAADQEPVDVFNPQNELFTAFPDGSGNVKVSSPMVAGGEVSYGGFSWSPDSTRIAYMADQETENIKELFTSLPDGSGNVKVSSLMVIGEEILEFKWSPDSTRIAYRAKVEDGLGFVRKLFTAFPDGTQGIKVNAPRVIREEVSEFSWSPDGTRIAYLTDELFTSFPDGSGSVKVNGPMVSGGDVLDFKWSPNSTRIAYRADQETYDITELFTSFPDGSGNVKVNGPLVAVEDDDEVSYFSW